MKITKKTRMSKILEEKPKVAKLLIETGMHCVGCPMAMQETLEQGCLAHGMNKKEIDELVKELNKK
jgi:hydroxylamine reductase